MAPHLNHRGSLVCQVAILLSSCYCGWSSVINEKHVASGKCPTFAAVDSFNQSQFQGSWFVSYEYNPQKFRRCQNFNFTSASGLTMIIQGYATTSECVAFESTGISYSSNPKTPGVMTWYWDHLGALNDHVTVVDTDHGNYAVLVLCNDLGLLHHNYALLLTREKNIPPNTARVASYVNKIHQVIQPLLSLNQNPFYHNRTCTQGCNATYGNGFIDQEFSLPQSVNTVVDQSHHGKLITVSAAWRIDDSESDRAGREALKDLQGKVGQLAIQLQDGLQAVRTEMAALEKGQQRKVNRQLEKKLEKINARMSCLEDSAMTYSPWGCYMVVKTPKTWDDARAHCSILGLELPSLNAVQTRKQLLELGYDLGLKFPNGFWIGLTRDPSEDGQWRWSNGARLDAGSPLWLDNEPRNRETYDKGYFDGGVGLAVYKGSSTNYYLCVVP